ncbi:glycosyltransferase family 4 protein [Candidatus Uhrbacteria bacterium]|nr:glycosyltransferase family 4 protein [Candidatus Uhrbacteria bacterium]
MRIAIDGTTLCAPDGSRGAGIEHYTWSILTAMITLSPEDLFFIFVPASLPFESIQQLKALGPHVKILSPFRPTFSFISRHLFLPLRILIQRPDVFFSPFGQIPLGWRGKAVVTVHDLAIYDHPEWFPSNQDFSTRVLVPGSLARADGLIAVSRATQKKLQDLFPQTQDRVHVIYEGVSLQEVHEAVTHTNQSSRLFPFDRDVVLMLGTIEPRKNIVNALRAFDLFLQSHPEQVSQARCVLAGKMGWHTQEVEQVLTQINTRWRSIEPDGVIVFLGPVTEQQKWQLLSRAACLLYPSYDEGFGLPLLEAMTVGTSVIASDRGALPEVGGEAVVYVDPEDIEAMSFALTQCLLVPEGMRELRELGIQRASEFSWERAAQQTLDILRKVANQ